MTGRPRGVAALVLLSCACSRRTSDESAAPIGSTSASAAPALATAAPAAKPAQSATTASTWSGKYTSQAGSLYVYDGGEWKGVRFRGDDASVGLGDGALEWTLDAKSGVLRGTGSGALGDIVLTGALTGEAVTFTVLRKDPKDRGLTGTGAGKIAAGGIAGEMRLSQGDAHVIRVAKFEATRRVP